MPYSPDGDSDFKGKLPNPKLNPMTNPTLGRNLGRWAQVYFTTPPEKREEAVVELLRELEAKSEIHKDGPEVPHHPQNSEVFPEPTRVKITEAEPLKSEPRHCPECHHKYLPNQCFCGICGSPLKGSTEQSVRPESPAIDLPRATANDPLFSGSIPNSVSKHAGTDVQWLREKTLAELGIEAGKPRSFGKSVAVILVFLLLLFFYVQWRSQSTVNPTSRSTSNSPAPVSSAPRPNSQTAPAQVPANKTQSKTASPPASQLQKTDEGNSANAEANPSRTTSAAQSESRIVKPAEHNPPSLAFRKAAIRRKCFSSQLPEKALPTQPTSSGICSPRVANKTNYKLGGLATALILVCDRGNCVPVTWQPSAREAWLHPVP